MKHRFTSIECEYNIRSFLSANEITNTLNKLKNRNKQIEAFTINQITKELYNSFDISLFININRDLPYWKCIESIEKTIQEIERN